MPYSPRIVANAFLWKKGAAGLSHMKLQKLVFFVHAWALALNNQRLVTESPEAWPYGPVFTSLYHELKQFGSQNITMLLQELNPATGQLAALIPNEKDATFWSLFDRVWDRYGRLSAMQLSSLTHETGGPWERARSNFAGEIRDEWIADYYRAQLTPAPAFGSFSAAA